MGLVYIFIKKVGYIYFAFLFFTASSVAEGCGDLCHECSKGFLKIKNVVF